MAALLAAAAIAAALAAAVPPDAAIAAAGTGGAIPAAGPVWPPVPFATPSAAEVEHASRLIAAYEQAKAQGRGAIDFEGRMVDEPLLKRAAGILAAAGRTP